MPNQTIENRTPLNPNPSLAGRVRAVNSSSLPPVGDIAAAFSDNKVVHPSERFVMVAIAAYPKASLEQLAERTGMGRTATMQAIKGLLKYHHIYAVDEGYVTASAEVVA